MLVGRSSADAVEVLRVQPLANRAAAPSRFEIDPLDLLAAEKNAREEGLAVVGVWHSHPGRPAIPSTTDLESAWEGLSYLIVSVEPDGPDELRSWRLSDAGFREEAVEYLDASIR